MVFIKRLCCFITLLILPLIHALAQGFVVRNIRVEGLQRINLGTVLSYLPIKEGETLDPQDTGNIVSALYRTGFFSNVSLGREGNKLIINVTERPVIGSIRISGNKKIQTKKLQDVLKTIGIQEGNVYDSSILEGLQNSLQQEYYNLGQYNARVKTSAVPESRNRVAININIDEGRPALIKEIKIVGNHAFSRWRLLHEFKSTSWRPWTVLTHTDHYSQETLEGDLETLRSYYMDRGYLRFKIDSYQANLSPDKRSVHIIIYVTEGPIYHISGFDLSGNLLGEEAQLRNLIPLKSGEVFSRQKIIAISDLITHYYGNQGYAFTNVTPIPAIDDVNHEVFINFKVDPGQRVYVRRISFSGNTKTQDIVLRREMFQPEGSEYNLSAIEEGKRRLQNLGYLQNVDVKTEPVPGQPNQVDLNYNVTEMSSATASLQVGYSDMYGILYGANLTESNWLGSGKQVGLSFENSQYSDTYSFNYVDPYYTESGISRAISIFAQHVTPGNFNITNYTSNAYAANVSYGMPISQYSGINFGYGYQNVSINTGGSPSAQVLDFTNAHGHVFDVVSLTGGWERSTYDRILLPTSGTKQQIIINSGVPVFNRNLDYVTLNYQAAWYHPIGRGFIFHLSGDAGYGFGFGPYSSKELPFFKNFYAGGIDSVRGYESNSLGPQDSTGRPIGGNVLTTATAGIIIPNPWSDKFRLSVFVDAGQVFANQFAFQKIRYSAGIGVQFYIPMVGPLEFALARAINPSSTDQSHPFDFSVGTSF